MRCRPGTLKGAAGCALSLSRSRISGAPHPGHAVCERLPWSRLLRVGVVLDHLAGGILACPHDDLVAGVLELIHIVAADMLELGEDYPRLRPFPILAEGNLADDGTEGVAAHVVGYCDLAEAPCPSAPRRQPFPRGIARRRKAPAD